jgi:hypothetical protein
MLVFVAAGTCLPRDCLRIMGGILGQTLVGEIYEVFRSDDLGCHGVHTFLNTGSGIRKVMGGIHTRYTLIA